MRIADSCICCGRKDLDHSPAVLMPFVAARAFGWEPIEVTAEWQLRDIPTGTALSLCRTVRCANCDVLFCDIRFDDDELERIYADYRGTRYCAERERWEPGYSRRNAGLRQPIAYRATIEEFLRLNGAAHARILDWGGDDGHNTPFLSTAESVHIYDISAVAPTPPAVAVTAEESLAFEYDLIVLSNVLEHVPYPRRVLGDVLARASETTTIYVEVPYESLMRADIAPRARSAQKRHWHEHINFFSPESIRALAEAAGAHLVETTVLEVEVADRSGANLACILRRAHN